MFLGGSLSTYHFLKKYQFCFSLTTCEFPKHRIFYQGYRGNHAFPPMESITNRIGNGWLTPNRYSHWWSIFLGGWNWSVHHPQQYRLWMSIFLPVASSGTMTITKKKKKVSLFPILIFLCEEFKIYVVFINTVFPSGSDG